MSRWPPVWLHGLADLAKLGGRLERKSFIKLKQLKQTHTQSAKMRNKMSASFSTVLVSHARAAALTFPS